MRDRTEARSIPRPEDLTARSERRGHDCTLGNYVHVIFFHVRTNVCYTVKYIHQVSFT